MDKNCNECKYLKCPDFSEECDGCFGKSNHPKFTPAFVKPGVEPFGQAYIKAGVKPGDRVCLGGHKEYLGTVVTHKEYVNVNKSRKDEENDEYRYVYIRFDDDDGIDGYWPTNINKVDEEPKKKEEKKEMFLPRKIEEDEFMVLYEKDGINWFVFITNKEELMKFLNDFDPDWFVVYDSEGEVFHLGGLENMGIKEVEKTVFSLMEE